MFVSKGNYSHLEHADLEHVSDISETEPQQAFSVYELFQRAERGLSLTSRFQPRDYDNDDPDSDDWDSFDPLDDATDMVDFYERDLHEKHVAATVDSFVEKRRKATPPPPSLEGVESTPPPPSLEGVEGPTTPT